MQSTNKGSRCGKVLQTNMAHVSRQVLYIQPNYQQKQEWDVSVI